MLHSQYIESPGIMITGELVSTGTGALAKMVMTRSIPVLAQDGLVNDTIFETLNTMHYDRKSITLWS